MSMNLYRNEALDVIARKVIAQYDPSLLHTPAPIPVDTIIEKVYGLSLEFQFMLSTPNGPEKKASFRALAATASPPMPSSPGRIWL